MSRKLNDGTPAGYGAKDRQLAEDLSKATSKAQADKIARADGHKDAEGARSWLKDRS
jgi:hypothetical protein